MEEEGKEEGHYRTDSHPIRQTCTSESDVSTTIQQDNQASTVIRQSCYYSISHRLLENGVERRGSFGSFSRLSPDHTEHVHFWKGKSDSSSSIHSLSKKGETKSSLFVPFLEKCLPLMKYHYCVDEICYILNIPHYFFWEMVNENPKNFFVYYVASNV